MRDEPEASHGRALLELLLPDIQGHMPSNGCRHQQGERGPVNLVAEPNTWLDSPTSSTRKVVRASFDVKYVKGRRTDPKRHLTDRPIKQHTQWLARDTRWLWRAHRPHTMAGGVLHQPPTAASPPFLSNDTLHHFMPMSTASAAHRTLTQACPKMEYSVDSSTFCSEWDEGIETYAPRYMTARAMDHGHFREQKQGSEGPPRMCDLSLPPSPSVPLGDRAVQGTRRAPVGAETKGGDSAEHQSNQVGGMSPIGQHRRGLARRQTDAIHGSRRPSDQSSPQTC